jgi:hypothetical protein
MLRKPVHLTDQDLLRALDGEQSRRVAKQARAHLAACGLCRSRLGELEATIADLASLHRQLEPQLPCATGPRALLKARLAEAAAPPPARRWQRFLHVLPHTRAVAGICLVAFLSVIFWRHLQPRQTVAAVPDPNLTPGATRPVSLSDVCSMAHEEVVSDVPAFLRQQVFREYGIVNPRPGDYEVDYLIAPGLGGAEDIHNLWPEPATSAGWNAHLKDALEERLHQLVCAGKLDLPTAQRAIASNWIAAYKTYLGTEVAALPRFYPWLQDRP